MMKEATIKYVPRRGRPSAKQTAAINAAILTTARRMFLENGFDAMAMEAVAFEIGASKGTIYDRYPSKEALFHAVVQESVARWSAAAAVDDVQLTDDLGQRLRHHARVIAQSEKNPEIQSFQRLIISNIERFPALARSMHEVGTRYIVELIAKDIVAAAERDGIPVSRPEDIASRIVSTINGWHLQQSMVRLVPLDELIAFGERTVDLLMAARPYW
jgi:TetR/AcrR family transcriptional regulator, mexJK operon transcriptional repressor